MVNGVDFIEFNIRPPQADARNENFQILSNNFADKLNGFNQIFNVFAKFDVGMRREGKYAKHLLNLSMY